MDFSKIKSVYMLGIGGIGMSALARYFNALGKTVAGYDKTPTPLTDELISENINIHFEDDLKLIPEFVENENPANLLIIYTPAIPPDHEEFNYLQNKFTLHKRAAILGYITQNSNTIAIAGTHGKTTTSSIVTHLLKSNGKNVTAFLGGIAKNYNTNFILGDVNKPDHLIVAEADEFDRSFLTLFPHTAVITSMDADHLDIYGDHETLISCYRQFASQVNNDGLLVHKKALPLKNNGCSILEYSIDENATVTAQNIRIANREYVFDYSGPGNRITGLQLGLPGRHNVENAVAAITVGLHHHLNHEQVARALKSYNGVKRRFDFRIKTESVVYIDDYAHHPAEIEAAINSVQELYPDKKITVVFQPHLYTRTRDFAAGFSKALSLADETLLLPVYPARELPIKGINSKLIADNMTNKCGLCEKEQLTGLLYAATTEVVMTLGAGDIDQLVEPLEKMLMEKFNLK